MENTKVFFTDLDDTLLDSRKTVSGENQAAMHEALDAGHKIVINTGRPLPAALPLIRRTGLERPGCYAITYNGGLIYDCTREEILQRLLPCTHSPHINFHIWQPSSHFLR